MFIHLNTSSGVPIYRQITDQVKVAVATGEIGTGDKLPSVRALSETLVINPTTVQRAYLDLEREGVIETRRGQGTYALGSGSKLSEEARLARAAEHMRNAVAEAKSLRVGEADARQLANREIDDVYGADRATGKEA